MSKYFQILIIASLVSFCGCAAPAPKEEPIWKKTKITDLKPHFTSEPNQLSSINLNIYIFDVPVNDVNVLNNIWSQIYIQPLRFNQPAFEANHFAAGFGEPKNWEKISSILRAAKARLIEKDSIVIEDNKPHNFKISALDNEMNLFYNSSPENREGVTIGPGSISIRITAVKVPGRRGVCEMDFQPLFLPLSVSKNQQTVPYIFNELDFGAAMSPGNFVLLGPKEYITETTGLASIFFSRKDPIPSARLYLFVCGGISD